MKNYFIIILLTVLCFACKPIATENKKSLNTVSESITNTQPTNSSSNGNSISPTKKENSLSALKTMEGKTASQIKLFENKEISARLEKLMGKDYAEMKKFWQYETTLEVEENVLMLCGAELRNEIDNQYIMFMDTANDNLNVFHIIKKELKSYEEKGEIKLPKELAGRFEASKFPLNKK